MCPNFLALGNPTCLPRVPRKPLPPPLSFRTDMRIGLFVKLNSNINIYTRSEVVGFVLAAHVALKCHSEPSLGTPALEQRERGAVKMFHSLRQNPTTVSQTVIASAGNYSGTIVTSAISNLLCSYEGAFSFFFQCCMAACFFFFFFQ